jgi:hypothetical protein
MTLHTYSIQDVKNSFVKLITPLYRWKIVDPSNILIGGFERFNCQQDECHVLIECWWVKPEL